jgi:hypothetical protein
MSNGSVVGKDVVKGDIRDEETAWRELTEMFYLVWPAILTVHLQHDSFRQNQSVQLQLRPHRQYLEQTRILEGAEDVCRHEGIPPDDGDAVENSDSV